MNFPIFEKKIIFKRLQKLSLKKKSNFLKKWKNNVFFQFHVYCSKMAKNNFFAWIRFHAKVQSILNFFSPGHFFHTTIPFGCKSIWKMRFWDKFYFFVFDQNIEFISKSHFSRASTAKKNDRMKKMPGTKKIQNTLNFCAKQDSCKKNLFQKIWFFFQAQILQALENYYFFKN